MGGDSSKEQSAWQEADVIKWKNEALKIQKTYYLSFGGTQWHEFDLGSDQDLILAKICFAVCGPPQEDADSIESAYTEEQKKKCQAILKAILKVHADAEMPRSQLRIGFLFVSCKEQKNEFVTPLFTVYVGKDSNGEDKRSVVDLQSRIYKDWEDWKKSNRLPILKYCYPKKGFYTSTGMGSYMFDDTKDPDLEYGTSPQSDPNVRRLKQADKVSAATLIGASVVGIAALFTPFAPVVLAASVAGGASALYTGARSIERIHDKRQHGENLADLESFLLYFSLVATPLFFLTSIANGVVAVGTASGILSSNIRIFATILNFSTIGTEYVMVTYGLVNLIEKDKANGLESLDVLQFSATTFFFANTVMQPRLAIDIIMRAQSQNIAQECDKVTDESAKEAFKNFVDKNQGEETGSKEIKIIRKVNRMTDPNMYFNKIKSVKRPGTMTKEDRCEFRKVLKEFQSQSSSIIITTVFYESTEVKIRYILPDKKISETKVYFDLKKLEIKLESCVLGEQITFECIKEIPRYTPTSIGTRIGQLDENNIVNRNGVLGPAINIQDETQILTSGHDRHPGDILHDAHSVERGRITDNIKVTNLHSGYVDFATATFPNNQNAQQIESFNSPIALNERQYQLCKTIEEPQENREVVKVVEHNANGHLDIGIIRAIVMDMNKVTNTHVPMPQPGEDESMIECIPISKRHTDGTVRGTFHEKGASGLTVGYLQEKNDHTPGVVHPVATLIGIYEEAGRPQETCSIGIPLSRTMEAVGPEACIKGEYCAHCSV